MPKIANIWFYLFIIIFFFFFFYISKERGLCMEQGLFWGGFFFLFKDVLLVVLWHINPCLILFKHIYQMCMISKRIVCSFKQTRVHLFQLLLSKTNCFICTVLNGFKYCYPIIIMSCRQHGYPWPSLATSPYRSLPLAGLQGYIPYPHIAAVCMFVLVVLLLPGHMWGSIGVHHLWARPCFSSSVLHIWFF